MQDQALSPSIPSKAPLSASYSMSNMVYAPVEIGTLRIGGTREHAGVLVPVKHSYFSITTLVRQAGQWIPHELQAGLLKAQAAAEAERSAEGPGKGESEVQGKDAADRKLRRIPIKVMFNEPSLTLRSRWEAFDVKMKRPVCASRGGGKARRLGSTELVHCAGPEACEFAQRENIACKFFGRLTVQIDGQTDEENAFVFRSTSYNTLRNLEARLWRYWALFGQRLRGVPFDLVLRTRTTPGSKWSPLFFLDLQLREGVTLASAADFARREQQNLLDAQLDVAAYESVVAQGLHNGALSEDPSEHASMEEFFASAEGEDDLEDDPEDTPREEPRPAVTGAAVSGIRLRPAATGSTIPNLR